jgi:hypothetical protein
MPEPPYPFLAEAVLSIEADLRVVHVAALRVDALLDQIDAACRDAVEAIDMLDAPASQHDQTLAEMRALGDMTHTLLAKQHSVLENARRVRDEARGRIERCARRLETTQRALDHLASPPAMVTYLPLINHDGAHPHRSTPPAHQVTTQVGSPRPSPPTASPSPPAVLKVSSCSHSYI